MYFDTKYFILAMVLVCSITAYNTKNFECGPYGFVCEGRTRLRLCEGNRLFGPAFLCPANTVCNEDSNDVCENSINYISRSETKGIRCSRNERIGDPNEPNCKGYILCIPNKERFQGIKFKCAGNTVFNGFTRTCSSPDKYKCPIQNTSTELELFPAERRVDTVMVPSKTPFKDANCKNYKFSLTQDNSAVKAAYFCPNRPVKGESTTRCTVFSNKYCLTLERVDEDQFLENYGTAYRRPRNGLDNVDDNKLIR